RAAERERAPIDQQIDLLEQTLERAARTTQAISGVHAGLHVHGEAEPGRRGVPFLAGSDQANAHRAGNVVQGAQPLQGIAACEAAHVHAPEAHAGINLAGHMPLVEAHRRAHEHGYHQQRGERTQAPRIALAIEQCARDGRTCGAVGTRGAYGRWSPHEGSFLGLDTKPDTKRAAGVYGGPTFAATTYAHLFALLAGSLALPYASRAARVAVRICRPSKLGDAGCPATHAGKALVVIDCCEGEADSRAHAGRAFSHAGRVVSREIHGRPGAPLPGLRCRWRSTRAYRP